MGNATHRFPQRDTQKHCAVLWQDFTALTTHMLTHPRERRAEAAKAIIAKAAAGNSHRLLTGKVSPQHGNGTIASAVSGLPRAQEPRVNDPEYLLAIIDAAEMLLAAQPRATLKAYRKAAL